VAPYRHDVYMSMQHRDEWRRVDITFICLYSMEMSGAILTPVSPEGSSALDDNSGSCKCFYLPLWFT